MNKVGVLLCIATLLVGLTVPVFTEPTMTESSCGPKDVTDAEKEDVQMYLQVNNQQESSSGEQDLSAFQIQSPQENTDPETSDKVLSDGDRPSTEATQPSSTSNASSDSTSLSPAGEQKFSNLPTITTHTSASSYAREEKLIISPTGTETTASSNAREQETTTSPTVTTLATPSSYAREKKPIISPTGTQTTASSNAREQETTTSSTVTTLATPSSCAREKLITFPTVTQTTASSNARGQETTTSPTVTTLATPSSYATEQDTTTFPTSAPQTKTPFQNNEQEEFTSTLSTFLTSTGGQEISLPSASTSTPYSQDGGQELSDSQSPPSAIKPTVNSLCIPPLAAKIGFGVSSGIALILLAILIRYFILNSKCPSWSSKASYVSEDECFPLPLLATYRRGDHSNVYKEDDAEELEINRSRPLQVPPSAFDDPSGSQLQSTSL